MNTDELRAIPIEEVLASYGHEPVKRYGGYLMYRSPLREDRTPSLKVDLATNHWKDFGDDSRGSVIDLVMRMEHCGLKQAMQRLAGGRFTPREAISRTRLPEASRVTHKMEVLNIGPLRNTVLLDYAKSRGIDTDITQKFCKEVYYCFDKNRKPCFALGFENDSGGIDIRSSCFKGCYKAKAISTQDRGLAHCVIFEGFFDLLSFLQYAREHPEQKFPKMDWCVLNSTVNAPKARDFLAGHTIIHAFMDNDRAGNGAFEVLQRIKPKDAVLVNESARLYPAHNDFNEFLQVSKGLKRELQHEL